MFSLMLILQVLAEADLPLLLPEQTTESACSTPSAEAASSVWGAATGTAPLLQVGQQAARMQPTVLPTPFASYGTAPPPPFRAMSFDASSSFGAAFGGLLQGGPAALLQGGPARLACISAPAAGMRSAAAIDAVQYAHLLQDLRGRPVSASRSVILDHHLSNCSSVSSSAMAAVQYAACHAHMLQELPGWLMSSSSSLPARFLPLPWMQYMQLGSRTCCETCAANETNPNQSSGSQVAGLCNLQCCCLACSEPAIDVALH